ncbi:MAG: DNA primase, partial [Geminicoccaceae bacterium]
MPDQGAISLDEFKARLPLAEVVGRYVRLARRGRELWGCCPFHHEKTPSFHVVTDKGFYHCFGCGQHGNAIDFVMALEGLDFGQALVRLAELTGLPAPQRAAGAPPVDQGLYAANQAAARWFAGRLEAAAGAKAADYLARRGLDAATLTRFGLGYAPAERMALKRALLAEGFEEARLIEAGLLVRPEDGSASFDRFRNRVMFPIHDARGRVVGFGGRALGDARAKYLNTPETPLFRKGELLYGQALARAAVRERGTVIVVEGYMDVIALARAGFANAVAPLGTAIGEAQLALLWQLADEPTLCLDSDDAGLRAGHKLIERALPLLKPGKSLRFALMPEGADPDDVVRQWGGASLGARLNEAKPLLEFLWDSETRQRVLDTPERRAALRQRLHDLSRLIPDRHSGRLFRQEIDKRIQARFGSIGVSRRAHLAPIPRNQQGDGAARLAVRVANPARAAESELLAPILVHVELLHRVEDELAALELIEPELERLRQGILSWYVEQGHLDLQGLSNHLCDIGFAGLLEQLLAESPMSVWYRRGDVQLDEVLEGWRARVERHRRFAERRAVGQAAAEAIVGQRADEAKAYRLAVDRLLNEPLGLGLGPGDR